MSGARDQPPSIQDGPYGYEPDGSSMVDSQEGERLKTTLDTPTAQRLGREIWAASTNWLNSGRRARWNDSLRAFNSQHASGSKYLSGDYRFRSTLYRPKTRAMVRRDEAATATAFFSNDDVVSIDPQDDDDPKQLASAEILKALLQYRLTNTIPWFLTLLGARQDAEVMGICVAKADWEYEERYLKTEKRPKMGENGMPVWDDDKKTVETESFDIFEKIKDRPYIDLLAPENFRFEPGCDWRDPVKSSPYLVELQPFYIQDCMMKMESQHGAPAEWERVALSAMRGAGDIDDDVTRRAREQNRVPGKDHDAWKPMDYDICWTRLNIVRFGGMDWVYRTLAGAGQILEAPKPIREVYLHGERPYVVGSVVLETHKTYPSSKVELTTDLQRAANQDWNSRFDNVMLGLQPRQFVREGSGQDIQDLIEFMPGKTVMVNAQKGEPLTNTITWDKPPPLGAEAYQEQDRINLDWDDLTGAFTNSSVQASQIQQQSATGMSLMSGEASGVNEYELRLFAETFVEPLLKLLIKLEQAYETDPIILAVAGKNAKLFEKFNVSEITDELLNQSVTVRVNVGIGATNPTTKLKNFATGAKILGDIFGPTAAQGANFEEVSKEVFSLLGYKDGDRFFKQDFDPRVAMLQQQLQKAQGKGGEDSGAKLQAVKMQNDAKLQDSQMKIANEQYLAQLDFRDNQLQAQSETEREWLKAQTNAAMTGLDHAHQTHMANQAALMAPPPQVQPGEEVPPPAPEGPPDAFSPNASMGQGAPATGGSGAGAAGNMPHGQPPQAPHPAPEPHPAPPQPSEQPPQGNGEAEMLVQAIQTGNMQLAHALAGIGNLIVQAMQRSEQTAAQMHQVSQTSHKNVIEALTRKKKVVRGADGKVEGVE